MHCSPLSWDWTIRIGMRLETVSSDSELYGRPSREQTTTSLFATFRRLLSLLSQPWIMPSTGVRHIYTSGTAESAGCASTTCQNISDDPPWGPKHMIHCQPRAGYHSTHLPTVRQHRGWLSAKGRVKSCIRVLWLFLLMRILILFFLIAQTEQVVFMDVAKTNEKRGQELVKG